MGRWGSATVVAGAVLGPGSVTAASCGQGAVVTAPAVEARRARSVEVVAGLR